LVVREGVAWSVVRIRAHELVVCEGVVWSVVRIRAQVGSV